MKSTHFAISFFCLLLISVSSFKIKLDEEISISNEKEYAQLIQTLLGSNPEDISQDLKQYIKNNKLSLFNAAQEMTLLLAEKEGKEDQGDEFKISSEFLETLGDHAKNINLESIAGKTTEDLSEIASKKQSPNNKVHIIEGNSEEIKAFQRIFRTHKNRMLEETIAEAPAKTSATKSGTYITKFFFSLMFILVSLGALAAVAYMENGKDTLLYAKFIADVGR